MNIKKSSDDFLVQEILNESILSQEPTAYHLYQLKKKNYTTERAVQQIAKTLHLPRKFIGYAGAKDKNAITTQYITVKGVKKEKVLALQLKDIELSFIGYATQQLTLGNLKGNTFTITVYNPEFIPMTIPSTFSVPNYFDEQRFSNNNYAIGKAIILKDFKQATELIIKGDSDYGQILVNYLTTHTHDYVGAIHRLPKKIMLFYVHAVQSLLFNELLAKQIYKGFSVNYSQGVFIFPKEIIKQATLQKLPLIGFGTHPTEKQDELLITKGLTYKDFIIKQFPELSLEGNERRMFAQVIDCTFISKNKEKIIVSFTLSKGAYATIVLKQLFAKR